MTPALQARLAQAQHELHTGHPGKAQGTLQRLVRQFPAAPEPLLALAVVSLQLRQPDQAEFLARRAAELSPRTAAHLLEAANILVIARRHEPAAALYTRAIGLGAVAEGEHGLANTLLEQERYAEALPHSRRAAALLPAAPAPAIVLATLLITHGLAPEAADAVAATLARTPDPTLASLHPFLMNYVPGATREAIFASHRRHGELLEGPAPRPPATPAGPNDPGRRLRVAILSHEIRRHPVALFLEPWLTHHDRSALDIYLYSTSPKRDDVTERLKPLASAWRDLSSSPDADLERQAREDRIDIVLDTSGITTGHRAAALARRLAPIQAMYLGYPGTTGLRSVDFRIADARTEPPDSELFSTETLFRLEPTFLCFRPDRDSPCDPPAPLPPPRDKSAPITFGSFNSTQKINPRVLDAWARILTALPGSRFLLKTVRLIDPGLRRWFEGELIRRGVAADRIETVPPVGPYAEHLAHYHRVDVALDTFPYNGTTTTLEALWMGIPVVALAGETHPARVGESILRALARPEWLAPELDSYTRLALDLARDHSLRASLRSPGPEGLRTQLQRSPLMDEPRHAAQMDAAMRHMWREHCAGAPPRAS